MYQFSEQQRSQNLFALFFETVLSNPGWFQNLCQTPEC